ncbi:MAG TPA: hypothetical protein VIK14_13885 [Ignavibacteria bacterium]
MPDINIDDKISKYFWLVIPLFTMIYYISSRYSLGFYQDDEVGQYLNMIQFWVDPKVILGNNPKPGYKIFMVLPALLNYNSVLIANSFIASLSVYFTFVMLRIYKVNFAFLGSLLLSVQPLFFDLSFRSYSEIFTSLLIVIFLILYKKKSYIISGLVAGYIFTVRQEIAVFLVVLVIIFAYRKNFLPIIAIGVFPLLYNLLGYVKTGDLLFVLTEMKSVAGLNYTSQGVFHYFKFYIFIVGPVSLILFLIGFLGFLKDMKNYKQYYEKYALPYIIFITIFIVQMLTMINDGPNPGNWRYLLHISPLCAFFATVGFNNLLDSKYKTIYYSITGFLIFIVLFFLSNISDGFKFIEPLKSDYMKVIFLVIFFIISVLLLSGNKVKNINLLASLIIALGVLYLVIDFKPRPLSNENLTVKSAAEFINKLDIRDKNIFTNHPVLMFLSEDYKNNPIKYKTLNSKNILSGASGSLVIWENHYGYRPDFKDFSGTPNDVKLEDLQKDSTSYKFLNQIVSADKRFAVYIFEKK